MGGPGSGRRRETDPAYLEWIRWQPCSVRGRGYRVRSEWGAKIMLHRCEGSVQAHHVQSRGAWGPDRKAIPLCALAHRQWHDWGRATFQDRYAFEAATAIRQLTQRYRPVDVAF